MLPGLLLRWARLPGLSHPSKRAIASASVMPPDCTCTALNPFGRVRWGSTEGSPRLAAGSSWGLGTTAYSRQRKVKAPGSCCFQGGDVRVRLEDLGVRQVLFDPQIEIVVEGLGILRADFVFAARAAVGEVERIRLVVEQREGKRDLQAVHNVRQEPVPADARSG